MISLKYLFLVILSDISKDHKDDDKENIISVFYEFFEALFPC